MSKKEKVEDRHTLSDGSRLVHGIVDDGNSWLFQKRNHSQYGFVSRAEYDRIKADERKFAARCNAEAQSREQREWLAGMNDERPPQSIAAIVAAMLFIFGCCVIFLIV